MLKRLLVAKRWMFLIACVGLSVQAQSEPGPLVNNYPSKTVRLLVGSAAGGASDTITRAVAQKLSERVGQAVIVENRIGANGVIAMDALAQAAPDGHVLMSTGNLLLLNGVQKKVPYDVRTTFDPVVQLTSQPYLLLAVPSIKVNTLKELIAYGKSRPLNYGSSGVGSINHLGFELLKTATGIDMAHVPYKGSSQAFTDLMSGRIQLFFSNGVSAGPFLRSGKLKGIGVAGPQRMPAFPAIPTLAESGVPGFALNNGYLLYAPAKTPMSILTALNRTVNQIVNIPELKARFAAGGADPGAPSSPVELKSAFAKEYDMWDAFMKTSGIKLQ